MKELSIEEKAKRYDEALERARDVYTYYCNDREQLRKIESIFPELKENERIRKAISDILLIDSDEIREILDANNVFMQDIDAWLEKQGEQNLVNFEEAEKEKSDFVSGKFIQCRKSFNEFKEDNSYWLEYIGDDTYIGRSDNILNQKFHITPRQLYRLFSQEHCIKNDNGETNAPFGYGKYSTLEHYTNN